MNVLRATYHRNWRFATRQFLFSCLIDQQALKPGNVGAHGDGHGKTRADYRRSAMAAAEPLCHPEDALGACIKKAAQETFAIAGCNTNLGVLLLAGPLAQAYHRREATGGDLRTNLSAVLDAATQTDVADVYTAIRTLAPAGLGTVSEGDIADGPSGTLHEMMTLAAPRDMVARQYTNDFAQIFDEAAPLWVRLTQRWKDPAWGAVGVFLDLLARYEDSHIARIHGPEQAAAVGGKIALLSEEFCAADCPQEFRERLLALDVSWKRSGISPGTTADLTIGGVFAASLEADALEPTDHGKGASPARG